MMRFFRSRSPIPELHVNAAAAESEPLDRSGPVASNAVSDKPAFVDEAAEMERVKVDREIEVQTRKFYK
jgi:hypothetical protein